MVMEDMVTAMEVVVSEGDLPNRSIIYFLSLSVQAFINHKCLLLKLNGQF